MNYLLLFAGLVLFGQVMSTTATSTTDSTMSTNTTEEDTTTDDYNSTSTTSDSTGSSETPTSTSTTTTTTITTTTTTTPAPATTSSVDTTTTSTSTTSSSSSSSSTTTTPGGSSDASSTGSVESTTTTSTAATAAGLSSSSDTTSTGSAVTTPSSTTTTTSTATNAATGSTTPAATASTTTTTAGPTTTGGTGTSSGATTAAAASVSSGGSTSAAQTTTVSTTGSPNNTTVKSDIKEFNCQIRVLITEVIIKSGNANYTAFVERWRNILMAVLSPTVKDIQDIIIISITEGSVVVDFSVVVGTSVAKSAGGKLVEALLIVAKNGVNVDDQNRAANVTIGNLEVNTGTNKCTILNALQACDSNTTCIIGVDGEASCNDGSSEVNIRLIIGLCVGLPLALICIVITVFAIEYRKKFLEQRRLNVREGSYVDQPSTTDGKGDQKLTPTWSEKKQLVA